jgi:hypothetical protein
LCLCLYLCLCLSHICPLATHMPSLPSAHSPTGTGAPTDQQNKRCDIQYNAGLVSLYASDPAAAHSVCPTPLTVGLHHSCTWRVLDDVIAHAALVPMNIYLNHKFLSHLAQRMCVCSSVDIDVYSNVCRATHHAGLLCVCVSVCLCVCQPT